MLTTFDLLGLISALLPLLQRAQVRRLQRVGELVPFSDESRHATKRANCIAQAEGASAVSPVHIERAAFECCTALYQGAAPHRERPMLSHDEAAAPCSLPFMYPSIAVLAEAVHATAEPQDYLQPRLSISPAVRFERVAHVPCTLFLREESLWRAWSARLRGPRYSSI